SARIFQTAIGLLALVSVLIGSDRASADTTLRYKFKKGEKLNYVFEQKITTTSALGGRDFVTNMTQTIDLAWNIMDVDADGKAKMTQAFSRIRFSMDGPLGKVEYDSKEDREPQGPLAKAIVPTFRALAGSEIGLTMDPLGKISD